MCRYGGRPSFPAIPPLTLKSLTMTASITFKQVKNLLKQDLAPINVKLEEPSNQLNELDSTVKFLNDNYEELLKQIKNTNGNVIRQASDIANIKVNLKRVEKLATDTFVERLSLARRPIDNGSHGKRGLFGRSLVASVGSLMGKLATDIWKDHPTHLKNSSVSAFPKKIIRFPLSEQQMK